MKLLFALLGVLIFLINPTSSVFALSAPSDVISYTSNTLALITMFASSIAALFIIKGGYLYITSSGNPQTLEDAKKTIRNALIGLLIVLGSGLIVSLFQNALTSSTSSVATTSINISPITAVAPSSGLSSVMIEAVNGFLQNMVQSASKPILDSLFTFLTLTPSVVGNSAIFNMWLVILGITDALFVLVVAMLGLHFMSASSLGFEEVELKQLLARIGLAFLGANVSIFLADFIITTSNALVSGLLSMTGGLNQAWIMNAVNLDSFSSNTTPLISLVFLLLLLIVAVVLLLFYVTRLISISLAAVISPIIFLLWLIPKFSDMAEIAIKGYIVLVFSVFVHVVIIQLASSFLTLPQGSSSGNSLISIVVGIGLLFTLLKTPSVLMQMVFYNSGRGIVKKVGGQIMNVISSNGEMRETRSMTEFREMARQRRRAYSR